MENWYRWVLGGLLTIMSFFDIRTKRVPAAGLGAAGAAAFAAVLQKCAAAGNAASGSPVSEALSLLAGALPGGILLLLALGTKKAGTADGLALGITGACEGFPFALTAFAVSLFVMALFAGLLLAARRVRRDTRIPFYPFLTLGYLAAIRMAGGGG
ncbi:MAG: hypothetical protein IKS07_09780 [Lachnospiraceae bacterium]|nr:hypothetical protein [Lachnospiraceae bacterium]